MNVKWLKLFLATAMLAAAAAHAEVRIGRPVPAFDTLLLDGKKLAAADLKGRPVLVVFWATWCPTCRKELPQLQKLYERHRGKGFEIVALSIDAESIEVEEFWKDHGYRFPVAMRTPEHSKVFGVIKGPPTFFLIDRQGALRFTHRGELGIGRLEAQVSPLLGK
ncbi:MAG: alkyl hydroperoxide reductase [Rhodocyclaceae bacterium]|jgi:thiol-disulfide isomerase/thioredoxin|nr:alkyl hydroperoxide reductase [Rhodocyclaceae bacterium]